MVESIYVDSNAFILPVIGENSKRANGATSLLRMIDAERAEAFTSVLSWDEVRWIVTKVLGKADGAAAGRKLLGFPHLHLVEANSAVMSAASRCWSGTP
jgi:predicted nucleic acid-binding protein